MEFHAEIWLPWKWNLKSCLKPKTSILDIWFAVPNLFKSWLWVRMGTDQGVTIFIGKKYNLVSNHKVYYLEKKQPYMVQLPSALSTPSVVTLSLCKLYCHV